MSCINFSLKNFTKDLSLAILRNEKERSLFSESCLSEVYFKDFGENLECRKIRYLKMTCSVPLTIEHER